MQRQRGNIYFLILIPGTFFLLLWLWVYPEMIPNPFAEAPGCKFCPVADFGPVHYAYAEGPHARDLAELRRRSLTYCQQAGQLQCTVLVWLNSSQIPAFYPPDTDAALQIVARYDADWSQGTQRICPVVNGAPVTAKCF